jgi:hypothetical protein
VSDSAILNVSPGPSSDNGAVVVVLAKTSLTVGKLSSLLGTEAQHIRPLWVLSDLGLGQTQTGGGGPPASLALPDKCCLQEFGVIPGHGDETVHVDQRTDAAAPFRVSLSEVYLLGVSKCYPGCMRFSQLYILFYT